VRQISMLEWTRRLPFVPFAIHCSDGVRYEIRNPELVVASMTEVSITLPSSADGGPPLVLSYYQIVRIEPLQPAANAGTESNGPAGG
jgi:hypothetical protein